MYKKLAAFVYTSDCEEGNKKALENISKQTEEGTIDPELALMVGLPDAIHVGKSLKCSFANWYILLKGQRSNLAILRTLRDNSDPETRKLFRKLLKDSEAVRNKDRMAVDPILDLTAESFIHALQNVELIVHTLVPERFKFTEDNKVGAYPHPVAIANAGGGILFMLDFAPLNSQGKLVKLQLHNPVRATVVREKLSNAKSLCASNGFVFVCTADGIVVVEHTSKAALQVQSLRKPELIAELPNREINVTGTVNELKATLKTEVGKLKAKYSSEHKQTDVLQLNEDISSFDSVCSASDEILFVSSSAEQKIYQILIQKDGVGLVGSVTQLLTYPANVAKITSTTTFNGNLFFSSEGTQGGLFQVNLDSKVVTCLVKTSPHCEVHGIAPYNRGIAFSDPKTRQVKQCTCSTGVSILAGTGKEGTGKGNAKFASFMQPSGLCSELECNLILCDSQLGEVSIITGLEGTGEFLSSIGKMYRSFGIHKKHTSLVPLPADKYEANLKSVADYIKSSVDEVKEVSGKNTTNGPNGTVSSKTASSVQMVSDGVHKLNNNIQLVNGDLSVDLECCMTGQVESLHSTHHHKHEAGAHVIDYARGFGNTAKEGVKRTTLWAAHYFTNKKSYYPVPSNSIRFWDIPFLPPLPAVHMNDEDQEYMREWARNNGKSVRQRTVRQETTKYKAGTLPLNMYESKQPVGGKIQFETPPANELNANHVDNNSSENQDENHFQEYSEESDSSDSEIGDDDESESAFSFLRTTRSGRSITINRGLFQ